MRRQGIELAIILDKAPCLHDRSEPVAKTFKCCDFEEISIMDEPDLPRLADKIVIAVEGNGGHLK